MKIERFEDLECWKEARILVNVVYEAINSSEKFRGDYQLRNQITDAAVSRQRAHSIPFYIKKLCNRSAK